MIDAAALVLQRILNQAAHYGLGVGNINRFQTWNGWIAYHYRFFEHGTWWNEWRYVAPHFNTELARLQDEGHHEWCGEWHLDGKTLHCRICGRDGT